MKRRWVGLGLLFLIFALGAIFTWFSAVNGGVRPGSLLYKWQLASEQLYQGTLRDEALVRYKLELIDRRFADLALASGTIHELSAQDAFELTLQVAVQGVDISSPETLTAMRNALLDLSERAPVAIQYLNSVVKDEAALADLEARIRYIRAWAVDPELPAQVLSAAVENNWNAQALHAGFPLQRAHLETVCEDCHREKVYASVDSECTACHEEIRPDRHFPGACNFCHTEMDWESAAYSHEGVADLDCAGCHANKAPVNHHQAQCSACHEIGDWEAVVFNHEAVGTADCQRCHQGEQPSDHFPGGCSLCHKPNQWEAAAFEHLSVDTCRGCHEKSRPAAHFPGDCTACHAPGEWGGAVFNHRGVESCVQCHERWRPVDHFEGDCSLCHLPGTFANATFNHEGAEDCLACHLEDRSAGHFERQCSQCHNTEGWSNPVFSHTFPRNHGGANPNSCGTCHAAGLGGYTCFACHDAGKIDREHRDEGVNYHFNCAACHPWGHD